MVPSVLFLKDSYPVLTRSNKFVFNKDKPKNWLLFKDIPGVIVSLSEESFFNRKEDDISKNKLEKFTSYISKELSRRFFVFKRFEELKQFLVSFKLDKYLSKDKLIEIYLNIVEVGPTIYGIKKASDFYFRKQISSLSIKETIFIFTLIENLDISSKSFWEKRINLEHEKKINDLLILLLENNIINNSQFNKSKEENLWFEKKEG